MTTTSCSRGLLAAALLAGAGACAVPDAPRPLPAPALGDPSSPFRDAVAAGGELPPGGELGTAGAASGFEVRLRRRLNAGTGAGDQPATEAQQSVRMGSGLVGRLPERGDDWRWARDGGVVLAVHSPGGGTPDTLIFTQPLASAVERRPAAELDRFLLAVDPGLASDWIGLGSEIAPLAIPAAADLELDPRQALRAARMLLTPTLGRGLGYGHERGSFSGWRWIGRNPHGIFVRLGRTRGVWGGERRLPDEVTKLLERLASRSPDLAPLLWLEPAPLPESRAAMTFGTATGPAGAGIHLAILCRLLPDCPTANELGRFLESLASPTASDQLDTHSTSDGGDLPSLATRAGLVLQSAAPIEETDLAELLRSAASAARSDAAATTAGAADATAASIPETEISRSAEPPTSVGLEPERASPEPAQ